MTRSRSVSDVATHFKRTVFACVYVVLSDRSSRRWFFFLFISLEDSKNLSCQQTIQLNFLEKNVVLRLEHLHVHCTL